MTGSAPEIELYGTADDSIVDGPGIRLAIFVQGCAQACPGCHNPQAQPYSGGKAVSAQELVDKVRANPLLAGITLSGGEPFDQAQALLPLAKTVREMGLTVWAYSGYTFEELYDAQGLELKTGEPDAGLALQSSEHDAGWGSNFNNQTAARRELLRFVDVLVDGPYLESQRDLDLLWRGSANQRVIDVAATLAAGEVVLFA
jgi:anaerobic ribonucleoside-triphosphate reductase activating protein